MPELSILIVSHNTRADLERCLQSLHDTPPDIDHEICVIDNASVDGSVEAVRSQWPSVAVIPLDANVGFARANNEGFRKTRGPLVLLMNSDTVVPAGAVDHLVQRMAQLPGAAIVGPKLVNGQGHAELSFGRMISPLAELRQKRLVRGPQARIERMTSAVQTVDWVSGACLLIRRAAAEAAGFFDERYFMYCEDVDLCAAVRAQGGRVYFVPSPVVVHLRGRSAAVNPSATDAAYRRSQLAFYEKHHPRWVPILRLYLTLRGKTADK